MGGVKVRLWKKMRVTGYKSVWIFVNLPMTFRQQQSNDHLNQHIIMNKTIKLLCLALSGLFLPLMGTSCANAQNNPSGAQGSDSTACPTVYFTMDITPESLVKIYEALGVKAEGRVAVKISTGEAGGHNYLKPELIGSLVHAVNGTIVECNTAYAGQRMKTEDHMKVIEDHGFTRIAKVDIMDAEGEMKIPVADDKWIKHDIVGSHLANYDFMINLAHFKGHAMGGFGGVLKNASIGVASANGKTYIHTAGKADKVEDLWTNLPEGWDKAPENNDPFIESMAAAAQAVHNYFAAKNGIVYINVMNNMSIDCDCDSHPADPLLKDRGIMASTDPVALDKACLDVVFGITPTEGDDNGPLIERIRQRHGTRIVERAEENGLGTTKYELVELE